MAWIFWQNVPLAASMALCLRFGVRPDPVNPARPPADISVSPPEALPWR